MRVAALPFSTAEGVPDALGRQFVAFATETLRSAGADIVTLNLMTQLQVQPGRSAFVNLGGSMMAKEQMMPIFTQVKAQLVVDGLLEMTGDSYQFTLRFTSEENPDEPKVETETFARNQIFDVLRSLLVRIAAEGKMAFPPNFNLNSIRFGTENADAFVKFMEGHDALAYIQQANGMVVQGFDPEHQFNLLIEAVQLDPNFMGAYEVILQLAQACSQARIGRFVTLEAALRKLTELVPTDYRAWYMLAEVHTTIGEWAEAATYYEKAIDIEPNDPALYSRLALAQLNQGMPVNAERSLRKALEREGDEKPSLDLLSSVLIQTGRGHEVPALWKERIDARPTEPSFHAKYAVALMKGGNKAEAEKAFENALQNLEDTVIIKRYYAPILVEQGEVDRAMDFYEDCLDVNPADVPLMLEYATALDKGDREFEIPPVLRNILATNPDPNTKARVNGWLIELEQPKRIEAVNEAATKVENGDFDGAIRELKPLKNWLSEYWRYWAVLANCYNHLGDYTEAETAAGQLVNLMPGYEQGYGELMRALSGQEKFDQAYRAMKWAATNMPQSLPINLNLGLAAKQAGHVDEARALAKQIREALGANAEFEPVLTEMEK